MQHKLWQRLSLGLSLCWLLGISSMEAQATEINSVEDIIVAANYQAESNATISAVDTQASNASIAVNSAAVDALDSAAAVEALDKQVVKQYMRTSQSFIVNLETLPTAYQLAVYFILHQDFSLAKELSEKIAYGFPYTVYAERSSLMAAYAYYRLSDLDGAIATLTVFLENYDDSEYIDYATFFLAMLRYQNITRIGTSYLIDQAAREAFLAALRVDYQGKYQHVIRQKLNLLNHHILQSQMATADYYYRIQDYAAAITRYQEVLRHAQEFKIADYNRNLYQKIANSFAKLTLTEEADYWHLQATQ